MMEEQEIQMKAKELIELKREINLLNSEEQKLKAELMPYIKCKGAVAFDIGRVYYGESKGSKRFNRGAVLQYLRDTYGDILADQVDKDCTKNGEPREFVCVHISDLQRIR
ncbi:MAG: hypothetical protein J7L08_02235 [Candidatus Aenigmarchaeota archaeon]|nr:hypothetical protein [Candidatus Aenigmarchaeota archaeon]